jgi:tetratricopeptide (TPR) repeat protein
MNDPNLSRLFAAKRAASETCRSGKELWGLSSPQRSRGWCAWGVAILQSSVLLVSGAQVSPPDAAAGGERLRAGPVSDRTTSETQDSNAKTHLDRARLLVSQNQWVAASHQAQLAVNLYPANPEALTLLAKIQFRLGEREAAIEQFTKIVKAHPDSGEAHMNLGVALAGSTDPSGALAELSEAVRLSPSSSEAHYFRARRLEELARSDEATTELKTAIALRPENLEAIDLLAEIEVQAGHSAEAIALLQKSLKLRPRRAETEFLLGEELSKTGQESSAITHWQRATLLDPDCDRALYRLFVAFRTTDPTLTAHYKAAFETAHARLEARLQNDVGVKLAAEGRWNEAIIELESGLKTCGTCAFRAELEKNLGLIQAKAGDYTNAKRSLENARKERPEDAEIQRALEVLNGR